MSSTISFKINAAGQSITPCKYNPHYCVGGWWCMNKCRGYFGRVISKMEVACVGDDVNDETREKIKKDAEGYYQLYKDNIGKDNFVLTSMPEFCNTLNKVDDMTLETFKVALYKLSNNPLIIVDQKFLDMCKEEAELIQNINNKK